MIVVIAVSIITAVLVFLCQRVGFGWAWMKVVTTYKAANTATATKINSTILFMFIMLYVKKQQELQI